MSTTFDRGNAAGRRALDVVPAATANGQRRPAARRKNAGRARHSTARGFVPSWRAVARWRPSWRPGRAGFFAAAILALSALGIIYLVQISHVAVYGYALADLQRRQAGIDRENDLLQHRISGERTLARAADYAGRDYGMQPYGGVALPTPTAGTGAVVSTRSSGPASSAPQKRFVTVGRPAAAPPLALPAPTRPGLLDRLWNRLFSVGVATAP